ncbi:isocitrate lyase/PEP mutase family protein [Phreatobacter stygius]|uniref:Isocitrate lyase/phosphoenolpyruvate mutase family protein n=1 Tax=Phreatobacter stygius TaxID=1940610 RepID=A0A4D7BEG3_9HYPH|nr:isocitrate lyase/phosphoenolpyruvate mutase family protein [Phreatobacter stygius]QCI68935.1 isocitrate lyase/phosphoenolpyruvate mutase family protein [Phreatobacter stygius]
MPSQSEKAARFAAMHETGCFVLPNAWDFASAAITIDEGYEVIATTSAGVAFAQGFPDGESIGRERMIGLAGRLAARFDVPVTADLEAGYGATAEDVAVTVRDAIAAGLVGCNIEDGVPGTTALFNRGLSAARIAAGVAAARAAGLPDFCLNARIDSYIRKFGTPEQCFDEAVARARLYLAAGARSVFVPAVLDKPTIAALTQAIGGPVNVMAIGGGVTPSYAELAELGVRRVSLGGSWMSATYGAALDALRAVKKTGSFDYPAGLSHGQFMRMMTA